MRAITIMLLLITLPAFAAQDRPKEHEHDDKVQVTTDVNLGVAVPVEVTVPVEVIVPVDVDLDVPIEVVVPVDVAVPVEVDARTDVRINDEGVVINQNTDIPRQVPNQYFNYSPNFIQCQRIIGFMIANTSGAASLGIPIGRSKTCDIWLAVQEAQENGHVLLSYAFMCEIKNIKKVWGLKRCQQVTGLVEKWWERSLGGDSEDAEKNDAAQGLDRGTGGLENLFAQTDVEKYHSELEEEVEDLKAVVIRQEADNETLSKQIEVQRQEQQVQRAYVSERVDKGEVRRASARSYLERIQKRMQEKDK